MDNLKKRRSVIKSSLTRLETTIDVLYRDDTVLVEEFKVRLDSCIDLYQKFDKIQSEIEMELSDAELASEETYRNDIEQKYFSIMTKCSTRINRSHVNVENNGSAQQHMSTLEILASNQTQLTNILNTMRNNPVQTSTPNSNLSDIQTNLRMPAMQIPTFSGDYKEWQSFHDLHCGLVLR